MKISKCQVPEHAHQIVSAASLTTRRPLMQLAASWARASSGATAAGRSRTISEGAPGANEQVTDVCLVTGVCLATGVAGLIITCGYVLVQ